VRSKFNKKIRQGGAAIKFKAKPQRARPPIDHVDFAYLNEQDPNLHREIVNMINSNEDPEFDEMKNRLGLM
jgi:hypothetical protein